MGDGDLSSSLDSGTRLAAWRARFSLLYGYTSADRLFKGTVEQTESSSTPPQMRLNLAILTAGIEAPSGTGLSLMLPAAALWHTDLLIHSINADGRTDKGIGDVEGRLRQDITALLGIKSKFHAGFILGAVAPTGPFTTEISALSIGRGVWWGLVEADAAYDLTPQWGLNVNGGMRLPKGSTFTGLNWGNEVRGSAGVHFSQTIDAAWLPKRLTAVLAGEYLWRGHATMTKTRQIFVNEETTGDTETYKAPIPEVGGQFITATPTLLANLTDELYVSISGRLPLWRDANFGGDIAQLVPNGAIYVSFGGSLSTSPPVADTSTKQAMHVDPAKGPKLGEKPALAELAALLVPGKWTLVDYWAEWCLPCAKLGKELEALAAAHPAQVAVKRLDATAWNQTTWVKFLPDTAGLPVLDVFAPDGTLRARLIGDAAFQYRQHMEGVADQPVALPEALTGATQP